MAAEVPPPVRDAFYTVVGFGVLGFQRLQLARRDLEREVRAGAERAGPAARRLAAQAGALAEPVLGLVEAGVPEPGRSLVRVARSTARTLAR